LKKLAIALILVLALTTTVSAGLGGRVGVEYSTVRSELNWQVGLHYDMPTDMPLRIGFDLDLWTSQPFISDTFPHVGFAPTSVLYFWYAELEVTNNIEIYVERYCEHWMAQSGEFEDYVGVKFGAEYKF